MLLLKKTMLIIPLILYGLLISSCATIDEGENDIGYVGVKNNNNPNKINHLYAENSDVGFFEKNDRISIHLVTAFIGRFDEAALAPSELSHLVGQAFQFDRLPRLPEVKGEVAIFARVFELDQDRIGKVNINNTSAGRVVLYSDDVYRKQILNQRNTPIFGPVTVSGAPLVLRLDGLELDTNSKQEKALFGALADAGATAYPPASPALQVLDGIGSTFIDSQPKATVFMRSLITFDKTDGGNPNHLVLRPGYYVFLRDWKREGNHNWASLCLDKSSGRLMKTNTNGKKYCNNSIGKYEEYRDDSYLVIEVAKNVGAGTLDFEQKGLEAFYKSLEETDSIRATQIVNSTQNLNVTLAQQKLFASLQSQIQLARSNKEHDIRLRYGREILSELKLLAPKVCSSNNDVKDLTREQLDLLFSSVRVANPTLEASVRDKLLPAAYCKQGYQQSLGSGTITLDSVEVTKKIFNIT